MCVPGLLLILRGLFHFKVVICNMNTRWCYCMQYANSAGHILMLMRHHGLITVRDDEPMFHGVFWYIMNWWAGAV